MSHVFAAVILANTKNLENYSPQLDEPLQNPLIKSSLEYANSAAYKIVGVNNYYNAEENATFEVNGVNVKYVPATKGALATLGLVIDLIPSETPVVVVPINASISEPVVEFVNKMITDDADAGVAVVRSTSPDLSYVRYVNNKIAEIHEKEVVGQFAISGHYYFRNKEIIIDCLNWAMLNNIKKNDVLYIAPSLNYIITKGKNLASYEVNPQNFIHSTQAEGYQHGIRSHRLEEFKLGWIVGNFLPVLRHSEDIEIGIKHFKRGEVEPSHKQNIATELTVVISGEIRLGRKNYIANDIIEIPPSVFADFEAITDCALVCIKYPSLPNDKVLE